MGKTIRVLALGTASALVMLAPAGAQVMVEHAAAAAGATAGAAMGKTASDALGQLGNLLGGAAKTGEPKQELPKEVKAEKPAKHTAASQSHSAKAAEPGATSVAVGSGIYTPDTHRAVHYEPQTSENARPVFAPVRAIAEPRQPRSEDLALIQPGASRSEVLALGSFGSRITIPGDDGHLLEVLQYSHNTVRVEDGKVTSVSRN